MVRKLACTQITKQQFDELIKDLRGKIFVIIMNIEALVEKNSKLYDIGISVLKETRYNLGIASLYTHAIEQLGKLIMVKQCKFDGTYYDLTPIEVDFYDHDKKIDVALQNLPIECKDIFVNTGTSLSQPDFELRLRLLHSDIDNKGNVITIPTIDTDKLKKAIVWFKTEQYAH